MGDQCVVWNPKSYAVVSQFDDKAAAIDFIQLMDPDGKIGLVFGTMREHGLIYADSPRTNPTLISLGYSASMRPELLGMTKSRQRWNRAYNWFLNVYAWLLIAPLVVIVGAVGLTLVVGLALMVFDPAVVAGWLSGPFAIPKEIILRAIGLLAFWVLLFVVYCKLPQRD